MASRIAVILAAVGCVALPPPALGQATDGAADDSTAALLEKQKELEERIAALEAAKAAQEAAIRTIIRDAIDKTGSNINAYVALGGTFELASGWVEALDGNYEGVMGLDTVELDFEISVNPWSIGSVVFEYFDGDHAFVTLEGDERSVDRVNLDTAMFTFGNTFRIPPYLSVGRMIVPFGISTGEPVADVLTLENPLTIDVFETKEDAVIFGLAFPTPSRTPQPPRREPPPIRPKVLHPMFGALTRALGYRPPQQPRPAPAMITSPTSPPPLNLAVIFFHGRTFTPEHQSGWRPQAHIGGTVGYRNDWLEMDVDYTSSVFDSDFLQAEYAPYLGQIGLVPGMAGSLRMTLGPMPLVAEWNGAIEKVEFTDDLSQVRSIQPQAWQVSAGWQFGWNRFSKARGAEGTYVAFGYSQSQDVAGVTRVLDGGEEVRVGGAAERRWLAHAAEWMWPGVRFAVEYSYSEDYAKDRGGTGRTANAVRTQLTYEW